MDIYVSGPLGAGWLDLTGVSNEDDLTEQITEKFGEATTVLDWCEIPKVFRQLDGALVEWANRTPHEQDMWHAYRECVDPEGAYNDAEGCYEGAWESGADFAEQIVTDCYEVKLPFWVVIDWEATWECNLRHDYSYAEVNGLLFIFRNN